MVDMHRRGPCRFADPMSDRVHWRDDRSNCAGGCLRQTGGPNAIPMDCTLFFLSCLLASEWALLRLAFHAANDDGDGPPGLGFALLPAFGIFVITVLACYAIATPNRRSA